MRWGGEKKKKRGMYGLQVREGGAAAVGIVAGRDGTKSLSGRSVC